MANSKKLTSYTGSVITPSVPTAVGGVLVREIAGSAFTSAVETVFVDAYANDVTGAPWGAQNTV